MCYDIKTIQYHTFFESKTSCFGPEGGIPSVVTDGL